MLESNPSFAAQLERSLPQESLSRLSRLVEEEVSVAESSVERPSNHDLGLVCLQGMIPFIAFGFIDNMVLIIAGEYIDITFGVIFGISTMAAAALGNIVSDLLGIGLGNIVETWANRLGVPGPSITRMQERLPLTRRVFYSGNAIGMLVGCLLGMFPLLFIDSEKTARLKRQSKIDHLFQSVVDYIAVTLNAEAATLFIVDKDQDEVWTKAASKSGKVLHFPMDKGLVSR